MRGRLESEQPPAIIGPDFGGERTAWILKRDRVAVRPDRAARRFDGLNVQPLDVHRDFGLRGDIRAELTGILRHRRDADRERLVRREEHVRQHDGVEADRVDFVSGLSELHHVVFGGRPVERGVHREPGALRGAIDGQLQGLPVLAVADEHAARGHVERRRQAARPGDDPPFRSPANGAFRGADGGAPDEHEQL